MACGHTSFQNLWGVSTALGQDEHTVSSLQLPRLGFSSSFGLPESEHVFRIVTGVAVSTEKLVMMMVMTPRCR
eukprot:327881-Karenia_brevis.AAC.1